jgi:uncharacterized protein (TIGR03435 family)
MTKTQTIILTIVGVVIIAAAIAVKMEFFPSVSEKYFIVNSNRLRAVPSGFMVIRPTHAHSPAYGQSNQNRITYVTVNGQDRMVGVNVTFQMLFELAYNQNAMHITLPWDAPTNNFDVLVTAPGNVQDHLQSAILHKLGYVGTMETSEVDVLALKLEDPSVKAFDISPDDEKSAVNPENGRLYFTHFQLGYLLGNLEQINKSPMVDETGLTNYYDFSVNWDAQRQQMMRNGSMDEETVKKILGELGLGLQPESSPVEMLVVKKFN